MSLREKTAEELRANLAWIRKSVSLEVDQPHDNWIRSDLSGYISNGGGWDTGHAMNSCITRAGCFGFLLYWAWRCENMFECLKLNQQLNYDHHIIRTATRREFLRKPFHASSGSYSRFSHKKIGHWSPGTANSPLRRFALVLLKWVSKAIKERSHSITRRLTNQILQDREVVRFVHGGTHGPFWSSEQEEGGAVDLE